MAAAKNDPLLTAAKVIVAILIALIIFTMVMLGIGIGAALTVGRAELVAELARIEAPAASYWLVVALLAAFVGLLWLGFQFFRKLWALIQSVDEGDPFRSTNADLLAQMGWISVGAQVTALLIAIPAAWLVSIAEKAGETVDFNMDLGFGTILLTLVLFILARIFRHGAAMREDLEGTV